MIGYQHSFCVISDVQEHNTTTVRSFFQVVLEQVKLQHPHVTRVHYFIDDCGGQYKNSYVKKKSNTKKVQHYAGLAFS